MEKAIWATLDDYLPPGPGVEYVGRNVANYKFLSALLRYGHFDEYHFFLASQSHQRLFQSLHGPLLESIGAASKVKLFDRLALFENLKKNAYTVFHQSDHIAYFNSLCHLRNQIGSFPVTSFIHSLSYQSFMGKYLEMICGGVTSQDILICSSLSGKQVLKNCFQQIAQQLNLHLPPVQMEVIPLGVEGDDFPPIDPQDCRRKLGFPNEEVIGLCFGRFSDYDKMDLFPLFQAFRYIYPQGAPWRLILAGSIQSENYFKILELWIRTLGISNRVTVVTNPSDAEKANLYRAANFFISLSDNPQETFGLTLLEAMACGLPLIVSDFDGYRDIVTDAVGRRIRTTWSHFPPLVMLGPLMEESTYHRYLAQSLSVDMEQLAGVLKYFFMNPDRLKEMGLAAKECFEQNYHYRVIIPQLERLWHKAKEAFDPNRSRPRPDPLAMDVFKCFSHYVSQSLSSETVLKVTDFGEELLHSGLKYPLLAEMSPLIDYPAGVHLLTKFRDSARLGEIISAENPEDWKIHYLIAWMVKHDLLKIIGRGKKSNYSGV